MQNLQFTITVSQKISTVSRWILKVFDTLECILNITLQDVLPICLGANKSREAREWFLIFALELLEDRRFKVLWWWHGSLVPVEIMCGGTEEVGG